MTNPIRNRSRLMLGCGSAALALALALAPKSAQAQGIDATGSVVFGSAQITDISPTETTVDVLAPTVVIDWTPNEDAGGNALDFIRTGATATFDGGSLADFSVLNRILPSTNGNIAVIDGTVLARITDPATGASIPGGFVAFYSPTGILIGSNATFDVGSLMLTTLNVSNTDFQNFAEFGFGMTMQGAAGSTARIQINPGAQVTALAENSFFAVVAADVQMLGTATINGSHAYVAGEVVNLSFSNGLFNISVPVGTADTSTVMELNGNIGGPSSNGVGDNHMIYAVAAAQADPISMIFRGNLGFDPAQSAGVVNGEIILAANYNVFGRTVDGGSISDGIGAVFNDNSATSNVRADIFMEDFNATGSVLAIGTHRTQVTALNNDSSVFGNLLMVGRQNAELTASNGQNFIISGDVLVSAQDYGVVSSSLQSLDDINATGGVAFIDAFGGGNMNIGGSAIVSADAFAGLDDLNFTAGTAQGGQALIGSTGGTLNIDGSATVTARGLGPAFSGIQTGATVRGGLAQFFAVQGGQVTLGGNLDLDASATGAQGSVFGPSTVSDAYGGNAFLNVFNGGGSITIGGDVNATASAFGGSSNNAGAGSLGDAGVAIANIDEAGQISIAGRLSLSAVAFGGTNAGGTGGTALGGRASSRTVTGTITIGTDFVADALGEGGDGQTGGAGFGGIAGANAFTGALTIGGNGFAFAEGIGGNASFGFGGNGGLGRGGQTYFQADGTLTETALLQIDGLATIISNGTGGDGGQADGSVTPAGRGGDGYGGQFTVPNQADTNFNSGAFLLAGGDNGRLIVTGTAFAESSGFGGFGGNGGSVGVGGRGGDAFGGLAQAGLALLGQNGSLGQGEANFSSLFLDAIASAGSGGFSIGDFPTGDGGNALGGNAFLTVRAGTVTANLVELNAGAFGGQGANGGLGTGGNAGLFGSLGGSLTAASFAARAHGSGGFGGAELATPGNGGDGQGGAVEIDLQGISVQINGDTVVDADGFGGGTGEFTAGNGTGGTARVGILGAIAGSGTFNGNTIISSNGFGGGVDNGTGGQAGSGFGGTSSLQALGVGTVSLTTVQVMANGFGGGGEILGYLAGNGTGGNADITATGTGSQITIVHNVTTAQFTEQNFGAILSANGVGGLNSFGTGAGGTGRGGTATISAAAGGNVALPSDPLNDPDTVGFIRLFARGFGGNTTVDGGAGGNSFGGNVIMDVDGGLLSMGETVLSSFTQGGTAQNGALNVTGGNAFAGSRTVRVRNGGTATLNLIGGGAGAQGGNGTGTGNGGNAYIGRNLFEIDNATANIIGQVAIFDQSQGGNGQQGGSVFNVNPFTGLTGSLDIVLNSATINFTPDASGVAGIGGDFVTRGGNGVVRGGNAQGPNFNVTINQTNLAGGRLVVNPIIQGGDASDLNGIGGNALGSLVNIAVTNSQLTLPGETIFGANATGGLGGANGSGGNATSGAVDATFTNATINLVAGQQGAPGALRVRSIATGGAGGFMGDATSGRAVLNLSGSTLSGIELTVDARADAAGVAAGQIGADALGGEARISLSGTSGITADLVQISSNADTGQGGTAEGGIASLLMGASGTATVDAAIVNILADAFTTADSQGGIAGATQGGQARLGSDGGSLTVIGNVTVSALAEGAITPGILSGATARGGLAQFYARQGGSVSVGGSINLNATATGSLGSLGAPSSVSDAFGGSAIISVLDGGGTLVVGGDAVARANASGGSSNNAGAGSIGDAGIAIANIDNQGQISITGQLILEAIGQGGNNAGGIGGTGLGGRASSAIFNGGTVTVGGRFNAEARGEGGDGRSGGEGLGGIAGANAIIGSIALGDRAFAGTEGVGGDANFGTGGDGGTGRGGNSFFQANGTLTQSASISIVGDAIAFAQGVGGNGGDGNGGTIAAGRGGDGYGGQFTVPNQADPAFNSGAFILAGGDNGAVSVGGEAVAVASGYGGNGGDGLGQQVGGNGGNGFGGLAQVGFALFGQSGALGQGSATFRRVLAEAEGVGGNGGITDTGGGQLSGGTKASGNSGIARTGNGGSGTGGGAFITVRAGDITATQIDLFANGSGGEGALAGVGTGGEAALFGSLGGTVTATGANFTAQGFGGETFVGTGGNGIGGLAEIEVDGITVQINGDLVLDASGQGGASDNGAGGKGTGGEAYIGQVGPGTSGILNVTGHSRVLANGVGGNATGNFAAGNGQGGHAWVRSQGGARKTFGSLQVAAVGRGGLSPTHQGGNGTGGLVQLQSFGTGSQLNVLRNVPDAFGNTSVAGAAMLNANGIGEATRGGNGIGGTAVGGTVELTATTGGSIALPTNLANDPNSTGPSLLFLARAFGGGSAVNGGIGGEAFGGNATLLADGGTITMGPAALSPFAQAGNSLDAGLDITGGNATGGNRTIRVINGGSLTMQSTGGGPGGVAGNGSGTGNGGNALTGNNLFEVIDSTANLVGNFSIFNQSQGGNGASGGSASGGTLTFNASNATINLVADANGNAVLSLSGAMQGGNGTSSGGNATGTTATVTITNSTISGGRFEVNPLAIGGSNAGSGGLSGNATGAQVTINITGSQLNLTGETLFAADAIGGSAGVGATGGSADAGSVEANITASTLVIAAGATPGILRVRSQATGGAGDVIGNATSGRATLNLIGGTLTADQISVEARGFANAGTAGPIGGFAIGGDALFSIASTATVTADLIEIISNAESSIGGATFAGTSVLNVAAGSQASVNAGLINLLANGFGADPANASNFAGQFAVDVSGGNVNAGALFASSTGDRLGSDLGRSRLVAQSGNLNVATTLTARTSGDLLIRTLNGGIIGGPATAATTTTIDLDANGTIEVVGDGTTGGLGGQSIAMLAGRSILLNGNLSTNGGTIDLTANHGGAQPISPAPVSVITMASGTRINAGSGSVIIHLLDGAGDPQRVNGAITLSSITAGLIDVRNFGTSAGSDINVLSTGVLTASGSGRTIDLASLNGEVINLAGDAGLVLTGGGHFGIFAATPTGSQIGSPANYARRYNVLSETAYDALNPGGNFAAFRISPVLTVTVNDAFRFYGSANPQFTASIAGFLAGDDVTALTGTPDFTTAATLTSGIGTFAINAALGTLLSEQGYSFTFAPGTLTITPRPITVTANDLSRIYGNSNPALTFTVGGEGLVNGDQLSGLLATTATSTTGVGTVAITQGTLAANANYVLTFVNGDLTITPRPLTLIANSFSRLLGLPDPEFTFRIGDGNLVNGDQLSGSLTRDPGESIGSYAIRQGSLTAGDNYTIEFVNGQLTIDPPPAPDVLTSPTIIDEPLQTGEDPPVASEEEEERFGMDFPEQPDAPLISEDPLLDDPVTSGGDASLYSGSGVGNPGSEDK